MNRIVVNTKVSSDGILHLNVPVGRSEADKEVRVTVDSLAPASQAARTTMTAADLLQSGLVGIWADRTDIGDSREFARHLREQAQTRSRGE